MSKGFQRIMSVDYRALAVFRMGLALVLIIDLTLRLFDIPVFLTDYGLLPRSAVIDHHLGHWRWSFSLFGGSTFYQLIIFGLTYLAAFGMLVGYKSRWMALACWVMVISIQNRNPLVLNAGDSVLRCFLLWSVFLPLGHKWSVDAKKFKPAAKTIFSFSTFVILSQVFVIYILTAVMKDGYSWKEGSAIQLAIMNGNYHTALGEFLSRFVTMNQINTWVTLAFEFIGPFLLFSPFFTKYIRNGTAFVFIFFHLGLFMTMNISYFPVINIVTVIPFLTTEFWDFLDDKLNIGQKINAFVEKIPLQGGGLSEFQLKPLALAFIFVSYSVAIYWNLSKFDRSTWSVQPVRGYALTLRINQYWNMFAPNPPSYESWFLVKGFLKDGTEVDLSKNGAPMDFSPPESVRETYTHGRWRKYLLNLRKKRYRWARKYYANYLCKVHGQSYREGLESVKIYRLYRKLYPWKNARDETVNEQMLWMRTCSKVR